MDKLSSVGALPVLLLLTAAANPSARAASQKTIFVDCQEKATPKRVFSPISVSEDNQWSAYVEVDTGDLGCVLTTRLWVAQAHAPYRMVYMMPPKRTAQGNGIEILGWARNSRMLLVKTEQWQWGSDAPDTQQVLAIDAETGMIYEPELDAILDEHRDKQCSIRVTDAGFGAGSNVVILIRAKLSTAIDEGDTEDDVPAAKRCRNGEETWSFNYATGEIMQSANTQALQLFKKFLPNRRDK